jgi:hypothetical protein
MRTFWFVAGGALGAYASTRTRRVVESLTVYGIHDRLTGWFAGAGVLGQEFRAGRAEKETELRERLELGRTGTVTGSPSPTALTQGRSGESATVRVLPASRSSRSPH